MVFVTVGSAAQGFQRLLVAVDQLAGTGMFGDDRIVMQVGHAGGFASAHCEVRDFFSREEFRRLVREASIVICHGGATPLEIIKAGKVPIVMPRRKQYGEIVNDHQVEFVQALAGDGQVIAIMEPDELPEAIVRAKALNMTPRPMPTSPMLSLVSQAVDELIGRVPTVHRHAA